MKNNFRSFTKIFNYIFARNRLSNYRIIGTLCKTNLPSNTAFRGFGSPQGMIIIEDVMQNIAEFIDIEAHLVSKLFIAYHLKSRF